MPETTLIIHHMVGLHARPAALFVRTAQQFRSKIQVTHGERSANAKSILGILTLGVKQGAMIALCAEGDDADQALNALTELINGNFGEET